MGRRQFTAEFKTKIVLEKSKQEKDLHAKERAMDEERNELMARHSTGYSCG